MPTPKFRLLTTTILTEWKNSQQSSVPSVHNEIDDFLEMYTTCHPFFHVASGSEHTSLDLMCSIKQAVVGWLSPEGTCVFRLDAWKHYLFHQGALKRMCVRKSLPDLLLFKGGFAAAAALYRRWCDRLLPLVFEDCSSDSVLWKGTHYMASLSAEPLIGWLVGGHPVMSLVYCFLQCWILQASVCFKQTHLGCTLLGTFNIVWTKKTPCVLGHSCGKGVIVTMSVAESWKNCVSDSTLDPVTLSDECFVRGRLRLTVCGQHSSSKVAPARSFRDNPRDIFVFRILSSKLTRSHNQQSKNIGRSLSSCTFCQP